MREKAASVLDRVTQLGRVPGIVPLQEIHLFADPPCVQYPYLQAADLVSLVLEWRETQASINPYEVSDLIYQIAKAVGGLHALRPPIVHGNLQAANILLMTDATGRRRCLLANLGLGAWVGGTVAPEPSRDRPPEVRDDVYALGVLWYQLLAGDLSRPRPGGSSWRRRLVARGMPLALVELLESCFDDDADARPVDCGTLAEAIRHGLGSAFVV
jgi:serine/threonine protein kinase